MQNFFEQAKTLKPHIIFIIIFCFFLEVGYDAYKNFNFTSDGFHYYSAIRNLAFHGSLYEGPIFEYFLGNHAYIILILILPIVLLFESPFVLLFVNLGSIFLSAYLLFFLSQIIFRDFKKASYLSSMASIFFLLNPIVFKNFYSGTYLFQPDILLCPSLLMLFYGYILNKRSLFITTLAIIIFIKEEYIALAPFFILFTILIGRMVSADSCIKHTKSNAYIVFFTYALCSIISISLLFYFKELNQLDHASRIIGLENLKYPELLDVIRTFIKFLLPYIPAIAGIFFYFNIYASRPSLIIFFKIFFIIFCVISLKILENIMVYGDTNGSPWGNLMMVPAIFLCLYALIKTLMKPSYFIPRKAYLFSVFLSFFIISFLYIPRYDTYRYLYEWVDGRNENQMEKEASVIRLKIIEKRMFEKPMQNRYVILPEYFIYPFMEISHAPLGYIESLKSFEKKIKFISDAEAIIIKKGDFYEKTYLPFLDMLELVIATENYKLYIPRHNFQLNDKH